jgi:hypothetical protein
MGGYFDYLPTYGGGPNARACVLRVSAGRSEFDTDYLLAYATLTDSNGRWLETQGAASGVPRSGLFRSGMVSAGRGAEADSALTRRGLAAA